MSSSHTQQPRLSRRSTRRRTLTAKRHAHMQTPVVSRVEPRWTTYVQTTTTTTSTQPLAMLPTLGLTRMVRRLMAQPAYFAEEHLQLRRRQAHLRLHFALVAHDGDRVVAAFAYVDAVAPPVLAVVDTQRVDRDDAVRSAQALLDMRPDLYTQAPQTLVTAVSNLCDADRQRLTVAAPSPSDRESLARLVQRLCDDSSVAALPWLELLPIMRPSAPICAIMQASPFLRTLPSPVTSYLPPRTAERIMYKLLTDHLSFANRMFADPPDRVAEALDTVAYDVHVDDGQLTLDHMMAGHGAWQHVRCADLFSATSPAVHVVSVDDVATAIVQLQELQSLQDVPPIFAVAFVTTAGCDVVAFALARVLPPLTSSLLLASSEFFGY